MKIIYIADVLFIYKGIGDPLVRVEDDSIVILGSLTHTTGNFLERHAQVIVNPYDEKFFKWMYHWIYCNLKVI